MSAPASDNGMTRAKALEMLDLARKAQPIVPAQIDPSNPYYAALKASADAFAEGVKKLELYVEQTWGNQ